MCVLILIVTCQIKTIWIYIILLLFLSDFLTVSPVYSKVFFLEADYYQDKTQERKIILGKGEIINSENIISRVALSEPSVADLQILSGKQIFIRAKQLGITTLLIWEKEKIAPTRFDISVLPDIEYLKRQLVKLDNGIEVEYVPPLTMGSSSSSQASGGAASGEGGVTGSVNAASSAAASEPSSGSLSSGKIILTGNVKNAETIARALQIAGAYIGDQGIKIISQPGGQIVDGLAGEYNLNSNSDSGSSESEEGGATRFGARDAIKFTSNRFSNLSRGVIVTTQNGAVLSFLTVKDPPQISVAIRFYEISRSVSRNLGFNATFGGHTLQGGSFVGGNAISQGFGGIGSISKLDSFMVGSQGAAPDITFGNGKSAGGSFLSQAIGQGVTGVLFYPKNGIGAVIQSLQERGEIKSLAEPNLVIANGEPASFLAGGEVPIVRSVFTTGGASQDVSYEPFGIRFSILPTVTSTNRIFLQLVPEIRDIDTDLSNFVAPPGSTLRPPAFRTRRTQTQVELEPGQAFAISGLLREDNTKNLRKVPGIGDIPVLGTLFRSKSFRKGETELLIVVSPEIVRPTRSDEIAQLSIPDVPYREFRQFPPLRPYIKFGDEKGPDMKKPIDAGKYNKALNDSFPLESSWLN